MEGHFLRKGHKPEEEKTSIHDDHEWGEENGKGNGNEM
jgi:hypothetical protein